MSVSYEGKSPGKLWYFWQKTKGIFETKQQKPLVSSAAGTGVSGGATYLITQQIGLVLTYLPIATAGLVGMAGYNAFRAIRPSESDNKNRISTQDRWISAAKYGAAAAAVFVLTPVMTTWVSIGAIAATGYFGLRTWRSWKAGVESMPVRNFMREREAEWLDHQKNGTLKKRLGRVFASVKKALLHTVKWTGFGVAGAGAAVGGLAAAQAAGAAVVPAGVVSSVMGTLTAAAATVGIGAAAAIYGAAAVVALAIPAGIAAGLVCRNKLREGAAANDNSGNKNRKPFYKPLDDSYGADVRQTAQPAQKLAEKPAAGDFNTGAKKDAAPAAEKPAAPAASAEPKKQEELDPIRKAAAEARRRARQQRR